MSHRARHIPAGPGWSAVAVAGLLSGLVTTPTGAPPAAESTSLTPATTVVASAATPSPSPTSGASPVPTPSPSSPTPTATTDPTTTDPPGTGQAASGVPPTAEPTSKLTRRPWDRRGEGWAPRQPSRTTPTTPATVVDDDPHRMDATWTSYLPAPETGLKIFAAGLLALAVSIGGLAALAIRRRGY